MDDKNKENPLHYLSATALVSASVMAALVAKLTERGVLSDDDTRDIYDQALLALEQSAAAEDSEIMRTVYSAARQMIEDPLRET